MVSLFTTVWITVILLLVTQATDEDLHQELLRRPKHKIALNAHWQPTTRLSINATVLYVGTWKDISRDGFVQGLNAPAYTTVDFATSYDLTNNWSAFVRVENLFDRRYENPVGFLQPSVGAFVGIKTRF